MVRKQLGTTICFHKKNPYFLFIIHNHDHNFETLSLKLRGLHALEPPQNRACGEGVDLCRSVV